MMRVPVVIAPRLERAALVQLARTCHVAAIPSRHTSGYPVDIDEALALGLPVMASECAAAEERYGRSAIQAIGARDVDAWRQAFEDHLKDPQGLQEAQASLPKTVTSATSAAQHLVDFYRQAQVGWNKRQAAADR